MGINLLLECKNLCFIQGHEAILQFILKSMIGLDILIDASGDVFDVFAVADLVDGHHLRGIEIIPDIVDGLQEADSDKAGKQDCKYQKGAKQTKQQCILNGVLKLCGGL